MNSLRRSLHLVIYALGILVTLSSPVLAQTTTGGGEVGSAWVMPYMLVIACIILGLLVVLKSSGRRDRAKTEVYGGKKGGKEEKKK